ncbi:MAG: sulfatase-like hydrolase/transferase [Planctomycetes bacterium]|nr:sulfatase-like hydrolase/transferase [Planctomycetota bacterium]
MNSNEGSRAVREIQSNLFGIALPWLVAVATVNLGLPLVKAAEKPNIVFIFADDQCYETLDPAGRDEVDTPNLDRLVRQGLYFTHAYNQGSWTGAVCVASRTMLNTGRFLWHAHHVWKTSEKERQAGRWWSEYLKQAGYDTYMTGKWHVRAKAEKAFDFVTHVRPGMPKQTPEGYNRPIEGQPDPWRPWEKRFGGYWEGGKHWSEVLGDDAVAFLQQAAQRDRPFFMYLAFNAPHDPRQSPKEYVDRYPLDRIAVPKNYLSEYPFNEAMGCGRSLRDERLAPFPRTHYAVKVHRQEYYAIITHMDAQIGRILETLERTGKAENTYIFFTADHGLACGHHGLMGKQNLFDHSVRVPFLVIGPGVPRGQTNDTPIYLQDVMPTTLELAGVRRPEHVQFRSLLPLIRGTGQAPYEAIYGAYLDLQRSVTQDGYKLILYPKIRKALLFDLKADPLEMHDLASDARKKPLMKRLFARLLQMQRQTGDTLDLKPLYPALQ